MCGFPVPGRPGHELDEPLLDMLLTGQPFPPAAPEQLHAVAGMLGSLAGPAGPGELAGEEEARTAFARAAAPAGVSPVARRSARWRPAWASIPLSPRLADGLAAAAVGLGGTAAAYAGALPGPIQDFARRAIGVPAARHVPSGHPAECRLCSSFEHARTHGPARAEVVAFQKLKKAAGSADRIDAYCAAAGRPSTEPASHPSASAKAHAKAKGHVKAKGHPQGKPRSQPGGALAIGAPALARAWSL